MELKAYDIWDGLESRTFLGSCWEWEPPYDFHIGDLVLVQGLTHDDTERLGIINDLIPWTPGAYATISVQGFPWRWMRRDWEDEKTAWPLTWRCLTVHNRVTLIGRESTADRLLKRLHDEMRKVWALEEKLATRVVEKNYLSDHAVPCLFPKGCPVCKPDYRCQYWEEGIQKRCTFHLGHDGEHSF